MNFFKQIISLSVILFSIAHTSYAAQKKKGGVLTHDAKDIKESAAQVQARFYCEKHNWDRIEELQQSVNAVQLEIKDLQTSYNEKHAENEKNKHHYNYYKRKTFIETVLQNLQKLHTKLSSKFSSEEFTQKLQALSIIQEQLIRQPLEHNQPINPEERYLSDEQWVVYVAQLKAECSSVVNPLVIKLEQIKAYIRQQEFILTQNSPTPSVAAVVRGIGC